MNAPRFGIAPTFFNQNQMSRNSAVFRERHSQLIKYLASSIREFEARQTSTAMQRIARLPMEQFYDVSTDLHDELDRRLNNPDCIIN